MEEEEEEWRGRKKKNEGGRNQRVGGVGSRRCSFQRRRSLQRSIDPRSRTIEPSLVCDT